MPLSLPVQELISDGVVDNDIVDIIVRVNGVEVQKKSVTVTDLDVGTKAKIIAKLFVEKYNA